MITSFTKSRPSRRPSLVQCKCILTQKIRIHNRRVLEPVPWLLLGHVLDCKRTATWCSTLVVRHTCCACKKISSLFVSSYTLLPYYCVLQFSTCESEPRKHHNKKQKVSLLNFVVLSPTSRVSVRLNLSHISFDLFYLISFI